MRFILALLLVLSVPAHAQSFDAQLPMICGNSKNIVDGLREEYREEIVMMAPGVNSSGDDLYHSLWINVNTSTWSFIVVNKQQGVACVIASGTGITMFFPGAENASTLQSLDYSTIYAMD